MASKRKLQVRRIGGALGAEVEGVNPALELDDGLSAAIREAWLENPVDFFREQELAVERFMAFARRFGEASEYPMVAGVEGHWEITSVTKLEHGKNSILLSNNKQLFLKAFPVDQGSSIPGR